MRNLIFALAVMVLFTLSGCGQQYTAKNYGTVGLPVEKEALFNEIIQNTPQTQWNRPGSQNFIKNNPYGFIIMATPSEHENIRKIIENAVIEEVRRNPHKQPRPDESETMGSSRFDLMWQN